MKEIESFEHACEIEGIDSEKVLPDVSCLPEIDQKSTLAFIMLTIIIRAANRLDNDGKIWIPDFSNHSEPKYYVWFEMSSSGFRYYVYDCWHTDTVVGSRHCLKKAERAKSIAGEFSALFKDYMIIKDI